MPISPLSARCCSLLLIAGFASPAMADNTDTASAVFAAGCFWCVEEAYDKVEGVVSTISGFSGGDVADPSYDQVVAGGTGHAEAVKVEYDPSRVDYDTLLYVFWRNVDPFAENRQFCDEGPSYRSALFPMDAEQRRLAEASREAVAERFDRQVATEISDFEAFYPAETYHQNFYDKNPLRYRFYKSACGRSDRLEEIWGDEAEASARS
ncbi:peptide-methionine (S)-S-oxide reductase MsrA [Halomonas elongata]|uniref:Peptide methionine sulfoxide reductase MsrA n=2 Tax=Halomonas elongata TaxID=2746 RepID=E1V4M2_HALED|nr:peptide-methionine (S)-S-oxide reductase MsrA [Halomonas elongata]WBF16706.1 peptide-methionine (S)-S-oxide reductase MsrA [Halomonas elongata]WPU45537.1 peptide-methionine (S)-S-oxide reductase MsrA [Halomonas elongata DSM 2581]CBV42960.1 peptide methionine sulfoxide reductase MsrA (S-form specific) [Halomonas elongata DSM 2581]